MKPLNALLVTIRRMREVLGQRVAAAWRKEHPTVETARPAELPSEAVRSRAFVALVDYDNVSVLRKQRTVRDVESNLSDIANALVDHCVATAGHQGELRIRFYGGWISEAGVNSQRAGWLMASVNLIRGLHRGWRLLPEVAFSLAEAPTHRFIGTWRTAQRPRAQKMVDTMMVVDAIHIADRRESGIIVMSDDDDLVPGLVSAGRRQRGSLYSLRQRGYGYGLNDHICKAHGVTMAQLPARFIR